MPGVGKSPTTNEDLLYELATTRADLRNVCNTLDGIKAYMNKLIDQHATTNERLAVIERVQTDMKTGITDYQKDCTKERLDQDKRITKVEGFQGRQIKMVTLASSGVAFCITLASDYFMKR